MRQTACFMGKWPKPKLGLQPTKFRKQKERLVIPQLAPLPPQIGPIVEVLQKFRDFWD
jgi:hypothetical protein